MTHIANEKDLDMEERRITSPGKRLDVLAALALLAETCNANSHAAGFYDPPIEARRLAEVLNSTPYRLDDQEKQIVREAIAKLSEPNPIEKIALMHSELSEAVEGIRNHGLPSDHIAGFTLEEEEFADTLIRILDTARERNLRIGEALLAKMDFNSQRPYKHGKTC